MDYKITPRRLTIALVLFAALILVGLITFNRPHVEYSEPAGEALAILASGEGEIGFAEASNLAAARDGGYMFIDLRNPYEFAKGHLEGAINISPAELFSKSTLSKLRDAQDDDRNIILYANDQSSVNGPRQLLVQVGITNVLAMRGGFPMIVNRHDSTTTDSVSREFTEKPWYDYAALMAERPAGSAPKADAAAETGKQVSLKPKPSAAPAQPVKHEEPEGC